MIKVNHPQILGVKVIVMCCVCACVCAYERVLIVCVCILFLPESLSVLAQHVWSSRAAEGDVSYHPPTLGADGAAAIL